MHKARHRNIRHRAHVDGVRYGEEDPPRQGRGLYAALDLAGTKAARAYVHFFRRTIHQYVYGLYVGSPSPLGLAVGMAHLVARHNALVAYFAILAHAFHLLAVYER